MPPPFRFFPDIQNLRREAARGFAKGLRVRGVVVVAGIK